MADATAEPTDALRAGRRGLDGVAGVELLDDWEPDGNRWRLRVAITPDDLGTAFPVPPTTEWWVTADKRYPAGQLGVMPAVEGGLPGISPHQMRQLPEVVAGLPYRLAKICVATNSEGNLARTDEVEPTTAHERLAWQVTRAVRWVRDASHGELLKPGDPFELPVFAWSSGGGVLAVVEGPDSWANWQTVEARVGTARMVAVSQVAFAVTAWETRGGSTAATPFWSEEIHHSPRLPDGAWIRLTAMPVIEPYAAPITWGELRAAANEEGDDLDALLRDALAPMRDRPPKLLLLGFPVAAVIGGPLERMWWQPIELPDLYGRGRTVQRGSAYRGNERGYWEADRSGPLSDEAEVKWWEGQNWHADQLGTRGQLDADVTSQKTLMIGAGALGSAVAELLVRGGSHHVTLMDGDVLAAGNLVRHTLTTHDVGTAKAGALAARLNAGVPTARVAGHRARFPDHPDEAKVDVEEADLVIDTTGEDDVITALGSHPWGRDRTFVSVSVSFAAKRLFVFVARGRSFPVVEFRRQVAPWVALDQAAGHVLPWEGIGCWHPAFPARIDEIWQLAATAVATMNSLALGAPDPTLIVYERGADAGGLPTLTRRTDGP